MNDFFRLGPDAAGGVAEFVLNRPDRMNTIRVCSADAFFTVQEIHIGMAADLGVLQRLQRLLPQGLARVFAYTGDRVGAERALATGFVKMALLQSAVFDIDEMARAIAAWQSNTAATFDPLAPIATP